ncbi:MAG: hypothetical protein OEZ22_10470 [Spirochaetia bacterium]|nr:hypothetical protein [Spirochaetia bacterium]
MDFYYISLIIILTLAMFYLVFHYKLIRGIETKFNKYYDSRIKNDIQEFYREMESYSSLLENRINRFKKLIDRQEENLSKWNDILNQINKNKKGKELSSYIEKSIEKEEKLLETLTQLKKQIETKSDKTTKLKTEIQQLSTDEYSYEYYKAKTEKIKTKANDLPNNDNFSIAEEIINEMANNENNKNKQKEKPVFETLEIDQNKNVSTKTSNILNTFSKLGKTLMPVFSNSTVPSKHIEKTSENNEQSQTQENFQKMLSRKIEPVHKEINQKLNIDSKAEENIKTISPSQENDDKLQKINPDELMALIKNLYDIKERPKALQVLFNKGFSQSFISDASGIPFSDLEATKNIYGLNEKSLNL